MSRPTRTRVALAALGLLATVLALPAAPAAAAGTARALPVDSFRGMLADGYGHLYVATDVGVLVTDRAGVKLKTISYNQVLDLALSRDGERLYLAERGNVAISVYSTRTLGLLARQPLPPGTCPISVAVTARYLAFGHSCNGDWGGVGFVPLNDLKAKPVTFSGPVFTYSPMVRALPGTGDRVLATSLGLSPAHVGIVSPTRVVREGRLENCSNAGDVAIAPSGGSFVVACGSPYRFDRYDLATFGVTASYLAAPYPNAAAFSPSGRTLVGGVSGTYGADVYVYPAGASPRRPVDLPGAGVRRGVTFSPDGATVYAVAYDGSRFVLHTLPGERTSS